MSAERTPNELPFIIVPVWPILTPMLAVWSALLDISTIVVHALTSGRYPSLARIIVCTSVTVTLNAYCFWTAKKHRECREACRAVVKKGIARPAINTYQTGIVIAAVMGFSAIFGWAFFFTSN